MWVSKNTFSLMTVIGCLQTSTECTLCVFPTCVSNHGLRLFCLLRTDGGLWNQYILVSECVRLWGSASLWFFALQHICNYQHMAQMQDLLVFLSAHPALMFHKWTFALWGKYVSFCINFEASLEMRTVCAHVHLCVNPIIIIYNQ